MSTQDREIGSLSESKKKGSFGARAAVVGVLAFFLPLPFAILVPGWISGESTADLFMSGGPFMYLVVLSFLTSWALTGVLAFLVAAGRRLPSALIVGVPLLPVIAGAIGALIGFSQVLDAVIAIAPDQRLSMMLASFEIALYPMVFGLGLTIPLALAASIGLLGRVAATRSDRRGGPGEPEDGRLVRDIFSAGAALGLTAVMTIRFAEVGSVSKAFGRAWQHLSGLVPGFVLDMPNQMADLVRISAMVALAAIVVIVLAAAALLGPAAVAAAARRRVPATLALALVVALPIWLTGTVRDRPLLEASRLFEVDQDAIRNASEVSLPTLAGFHTPEEQPGSAVSIVLSNGVLKHRGQQIEVLRLLDGPYALGRLFGGSHSLSLGTRVRIFADGSESGTYLMLTVYALSGLLGSTDSVFLAVEASPPPLPEPFRAEPFVHFLPIRYWSRENPPMQGSLDGESMPQLALLTERGFELRPPIGDTEIATDAEALNQLLSTAGGEVVVLGYGDAAKVERMVEDLAAFPSHLPFEAIRVYWSGEWEWTFDQDAAQGAGQDRESDSPALGRPAEGSVPPDSAVAGQARESAALNEPTEQGRASPRPPRPEGRGRASTRVTSSNVTVDGGLDPEAVARVTRRHQNELRFCYERALQREPELSGRIDAQWTVSPRGAVTEFSIKSSTIGSSDVESCVLVRLRRWTFPAPSHGREAQVEQSWTFSPD